MREFVEFTEFPLRIGRILSSAYGGWVLVVFLLVSFFSRALLLSFHFVRGQMENQKKEGGYVRDEEMTYFKIPKERIYEEVDDDKRRKE